MKWPNDQIEIYRKAFEQVCDSFGGADKINEFYADRPASYVWFQVARIVEFDLQFDNSHPAYTRMVQDGEVFEARTRRCEYNSNFVLYPPGCHDSHRKTMLKYVSKLVGLRTN